MAQTITFATLRTQTRELCDQEIGSGSGSDAYIDDTELGRWINDSIRRWYGMLVQVEPERYETTQTITADGSASYALPSDYLATLAVEDPDGYDLKRAQFLERNRWQDSGSKYAEAYRVAGSLIYLLPTQSSGSYTHVYVPILTALSSDSDTIDGVNGWEQYVVFDAAIRGRAKMGLDTRDLRIERDIIKDDMIAAARDRDMTQTRVIQDLVYDEDSYRDSFYYD